MSAVTIRKMPERCLWAALIACTIYQSYRYPLQMNSRGTSPTYSDTPMVFQAGKFLLILPICLIAASYLWRRLLPFRKWVMVVLVLCMCTYAIIKFALGMSIQAQYMDVAFWPVAAMVLALCTRGVSVESLDKYICFVFIYGVASDVLQVILFLTTGRLPALAYAGTFSIRFGGFLDDPNASPALWYMLMGWAYYRFSGLKRFLAEAVLILCVLLTQSFTAYGFLVLLTAGAIVSYLVRKPNPVVILASVVVLAAAVSSLWAPLNEFYALLVQEKLGSVNDHLSQVTATNTNLGWDWLSGLSSYNPYESWWVGSIFNFGIPWYVLSLAVVLTLGLSAWKAFLRSEPGKQRAVFGGIGLLSCYFILGNANLPVFIIFPINFLFFFFTLLLFFGKVKSDQGQGDFSAQGAGPLITGPLNARA